MKNNLFRIGAAALALAALLTACGGSSSSTPASSAAPAAESAVSAASVVESESSAVSESVPESVAESSTEAQAYVINGVTFIVGKAPNDVTGNWRVVTVSEGVDMTQYAVEYYKQ